MFHLFAVSNSSIFQSTSHLIQTLLKYSVLNIDKIAELQLTAQSILKRLKVSELELLLRAIESRGGNESKCVFAPSGARLSEPEVIFYQIFRESSIKSATELKPLAICCRRDVTRTKVCINPYHYSVILHIETPTQTTAFVLGKIEPEPEEETSGIDSNFSEFTRSTVCSSLAHSDLALSDTGSYVYEPIRDWPKQSWCCIAYWEYNERVGPLHYESQEVLNIFETLPVLKCKGLCLASLYRDIPQSKGTKRVRERIGYGLQLSREPDGIWMYNRSSYSLFANGPTLIERTSDFTCRQNVLVHKVPLGYSLKLCDYKPLVGPNRPHSQPRSVRVSFAKGWGNTSSSSYRRQFVTSCPCWIEIHFFV